MKKFVIAAIVVLGIVIAMFAVNDYCERREADAAWNAIVAIAGEDNVTTYHYEDKNTRTTITSCTISEEFIGGRP